ncbi:MAG: DUF932 domain-containing protein [bacterium]|nr:DUF932 domain-containing protein [bacterium]
MRPRTLTVTDPFTPIAKHPLLTPQGLQSSRYAIVLDPTGEAQEAGIVTEDYNLVENREVVETAERVIQAGSLQAIPDKVLFDGRRFRQRWILPQQSFDVQPEDIVALTLDATNSYDGSTRFGLSFNLQRLICSNGMVVDQLLGGFRFKHNHSHGDIFDEEVEQAVERLMALATNVHLLAPKFQAMTRQKLSIQGIQRVFHELETPRPLVADVFQELEGNRAWDLYNAFTHVLTRQETFGAEHTNRRVTQYFLDRARG